MAERNLRPLNDTFPGNTRERKPREPDEPPREKIISGTVRRKRRGVGSRIREALTGEDGRTVGGYIVWDILIPAARDMLYDIINGGAHRALYGNDGYPSRGGGSGRGSSPIFSYNSLSKPDRYDRPRAISNRRALHNFDDIIFETRAEAEDILGALVDQTVEYQYATVADFYGFCGQMCSYTDRDWGWESLRDARISGDRRRGYTIIFPRPISLV